MKKIFLIIVTIFSMFLLTSCKYEYKAPKDLNYVSSIVDPDIRYDKDFVQIVLFIHPNNTLDASLFVRKGTVITQKILEDQLDVKFSFPFSPATSGNYWKDENGQTFDFSKPIEKSIYLIADYVEQSITITYDLNPDKSNKIEKTWKDGFVPPTKLYISKINEFSLPSALNINSPGFQLDGWLYNNQLIQSGFTNSLKNTIINNINKEREELRKQNNGKYVESYKPTIKLVASYLSKPYNVTFSVPSKVSVYDKNGNKTDQIADGVSIQNGQLPSKQSVDNGGILTITPYTYNTVVDTGGFNYTFNGWIYVDPKGQKHIINESNYQNFVIDFLPDDDNNIQFVPYITTN